MKMPTLSELDTLSCVDIKTVDPEQLVDIREVVINTDLPKEEGFLNLSGKSVTRIASVMERL